MLVRCLMLIKMALVGALNYSMILLWKMQINVLLLWRGTGGGWKILGTVGALLYGKSDRERSAYYIQESMLCEYICCLL